MRSSFSVRTTPGVWYILALLILILPLPWIGAIVLSSAVHELCHLAAAELTGARIAGLRIGADGVYLETAPMTPGQGVVCALAGPVGALLLFLLLAQWLPRTAVCAVIQFCYHVLPIHPLDGGRALHSLMELIGAKNGNTICLIIERTALALLGLSGLCLTVRLGLGFLPLAVGFAMIFRVFREKSLAKRAGKGYNISTNS